MNEIFFCLVLFSILFTMLSIILNKEIYRLKKLNKRYQNLRDCDFAYLLVAILGVICLITMIIGLFTSQWLFYAMAIILFSIRKRTKIIGYVCKLGIVLLLVLALLNEYVFHISLTL